MFGYLNRGMLYPVHSTHKQIQKLPRNCVQNYNHSEGKYRNTKVHIERNAEEYRKKEGTRERPEKERETNITFSITSFPSLHALYIACLSFPHVLSCPAATHQYLGFIAFLHHMGFLLGLVCISNHHKLFYQLKAIAN